MAVKLPNGATVALATAYGSAKTISAITNANPGVASSTGHGFTDSDIIEVVSGWTRINERVYRVDSAATDNFALEGQDTSDTTAYPAGSGAGTAREITTWTQIAQITEFSTSGGDMQFANYSFMESDNENQLPTQASAMSITMTIADDPSLAGYIALKAAAEARAKRALKLTLPDGSVILYNGYVSFNETPTLTKGSIMTVSATFSLQGKPVRYTA